MFARLGISDDEGGGEPLVYNVEDVLKIIKLDYEKAYFVTGCIVYLLIISTLCVLICLFRFDLTLSFECSVS